MKKNESTDLKAALDKAVKAKFKKDFDAKLSNLVEDQMKKS
jgi:hypothetical protein